MEMLEPVEMDGRLLPRGMRLTETERPGEYSEIIYDELDFDVEIPALDLLTPGAAALSPTRAGHPRRCAAGGR